MHSQNKKKIFAGLLLLLVALALYAVLHDFTELAIFAHLKSANLKWYKTAQTAVVLFLRKTPFFKIVNGYFVDFLWFLSFTLIFTGIFESSKKHQIAFLTLMAILSESSQLIFPALGTFDLFDLLLYFVTIIAFAFFPHKSR